MANKWAVRLRNSHNLGATQRFRAGDKIRSGPQVGRVATYHLLPRGSPRLHGGGHN